MKTTFAVASMAALLAAAPAWAQQMSSSAPGGGLNAQDQQFLKAAEGGNLAEVQLGRLASEKAQHETVKEFGRWMASDHALANRGLTTMTEHMQGQTPQASLDQEAQATMQKLQGLSGRQFDQAYLRAMIEDHHQDIRQFQQEVQGGQNRLVQTFAQNTLPALQEHLKEAQDLQQDTSHSGRQGAGAAANAAVQGTAGATQPAMAR